MAARTIIGIALGIFFAPIIFLFLSGNFMAWIQTITVDFQAWGLGWITSGTSSMTAPLISVIDGTITFDAFLSAPYILAMFTWVITGMWAGAIQRNPKRGLGVGAGIWLGWFIIELIMLIVNGVIGTIGQVFLAQFFTLILVIGMAVMFGAITRSEEF